MKKIYIVLTHTGTLLSRIIKTYTKDEFSHVSISLDEELNEMYSFGRLNPYNAFCGGFVHEYVNKGTFKRFYKTRAKVYSFRITDEQYEKVKESIKYIEENKGSYKFNILGLFAVSLHKKIESNHSFYCAEFVKYVLDTALIEVDLPQIIKPEDFKNLGNMKEIYSGLLRKYNVGQRNKAKILKENLLAYTSKKEGII